MLTLLLDHHLTQYYNGSYRHTTTARIGDIASLPLEYFLDNMTWPDPYTLTAVRVGIDYSTNPNAGIYLSNATSPFASIVTGSYVANSTSVTNANAGKNVADTAITFSYDTYVDEASRAMGLGTTPSFAGSGPSAPTYLPAVQYPFATSTATTSLNTFSSATTTSYTEYTPFSDYQEDTRGTITTYIRINGTLVATYSYNKSASTTDSQLTYVHQNYLGTPVLETNTKGDILNVSLTDINGNYILRDVRNDSTYHNKGYTGHEFDDLTQLTYAHARYLDTRTHTFTSVDPMYYNLVNMQLVNPQLQNAYSYANNNSVMNTDPTGNCIWDACIMEATAVVLLASIVGGLAMQIYASTHYDDNPELRMAQFQFGMALQSTGEIGGSGFGSVNPITGQTNRVEVRSLNTETTSYGGTGKVTMGGSKVINTEVKVGKLTKEERIIVNKANGDAFAKDSFEQFKKNFPNAQREIHLVDSNGVKVIADAIASKGSSVYIQEYKGSQTAKLTKNQKVGYPVIQVSGATIVGKGKGEFIGGYTFANSTVQIIRKK